MDYTIEADATNPTVKTTINITKDCHWSTEGEIRKRLETAIPEAEIFTIPYDDNKYTRVVIKTGRLPKHEHMSIVTAAACVIKAVIEELPRIKYTGTC